MQPNLSEIEDYAVLRVFESDFDDDHFDLLFSTLQTKNSSAKVVIDLAGVECLTSSNLTQVQQLTQKLELFGKQCIVCGINPSAAAIVASFLPHVPFATALDIKHALKSF